VYGLKSLQLCRTFVKQNILVILVVLQLILSAKLNFYKTQICAGGKTDHFALLSQNAGVCLH